MSDVDDEMQGLPWPPEATQDRDDGDYCKGCGALLAPDGMIERSTLDDAYCEECAPDDR